MKCDDDLTSIDLFQSSLRSRAWSARIVILNRTTPATACAPNTARHTKNVGTIRTSKKANSVCACGSTTHKSALSFACSDHKCTNCEGTLEPKGHNLSYCPRRQGCSECDSTTHKSALRFACPQDNCRNCDGMLEPKGNNRNDCPRMETTIWEDCGETGHSANKCPIRPCNAWGLRRHKVQTGRLCVERV